MELRDLGEFGLIDRLAKHGISNSPDDAPLVPIQVIVAAGAPIVPYRREQGP